MIRQLFIFTRNPLELPHHLSQPLNHETPYRIDWFHTHPNETHRSIVRENKIRKITDKSRK